MARTSLKMQESNGATCAALLHDLRTESRLGSHLFPFPMEDDASRRLQELEAYRAELNATVHALIKEFRAQYPKGTVPLYLVRSPDKSNTPIRWRLASRVGPRAELDCPDIKRLVRQMSPAVRNNWLEYEYVRIKLNYVLATTFYELERLRTYLARKAAWRSLKGTA